MKKFAGFNRGSAIAATLSFLSVCNFSMISAMSTNKVAQLQNAQQAKAEQDAVYKVARSKYDTFKQSQAADFDDMKTTQRSALFDSYVAQAKAQSDAAKMATAAQKAADDAADLERKRADEIIALKQAAEDDRKMLEAQLVAKDQALADAQVAHQQALEDQRAEDLKDLNAWKSLSPEEKSKQALIELAEKKAGEFIGQSETAQKAQQKMNDFVAKLNLTPEEKKLAQQVLSAAAGKASKGGIGIIKDLTGKTIHQKTVGAISGLAGLGASGAGLMVAMTDEQKAAASGATQGATGGATGTAGVTGGDVAAGQAGAGITLDLSKLTMPSLQASLADLNKYIIAADSTSALSDQLLKAISTSMITKIQDSFNASFAALKSSTKAEFNVDRTIEQTNAKILQDCKDLKAFIANFGDLLGDIKRKKVTFKTIKKTMNGIETKMKDSFAALFNTDMLAQFVALQQKVAKADIKTVMGKINTTVQNALDQASDDLDIAIDKRAKDAEAAVAAVKQSSSKGDADTSDLPEVKIKVKDVSDQDATSADWDAMVNS